MGGSEKRMANGQVARFEAKNAQRIFYLAFEVKTSALLRVESFSYARLTWQVSFLNGAKSTRHVQHVITRPCPKT
jgi:hypothetical protein